VISLIYRS